MSEMYALLIGIDCYLPNELPGGGSYPSLGGCVRDILHVEAFLRDKLGMRESNIIKLTSTNTDGPYPLESEGNWPSYENIVEAFKRISLMASPGDQVYIHYSGHGGRAKTVYPKIKGENGVDEALVPNDIGKREARYLRDVELAYILKAMVDKKLFVTIVLDSCHSGGATRGAGTAAIRGIGVTDTSIRSSQSLLTSEEELGQAWRSSSSGSTRNLKPGSGWFLEPEGYVLLSACRASESAYEDSLDGKGRNGALTYWLLDSLKEIGPGLTYKQVHDKILAKIHGQFELQTPQLQGEGDRLVFGSEKVCPQYAVSVLQVDEVNKKVLLNAGQSQGVRKGAQFVIYPLGTNFNELNKRLVLLEISTLGATESWGKIISQFSADPIEQGAQAVLLDPGTSRLQRKVCTVRKEGSSENTTENVALKEVENLVKNSGGFLTISQAGEAADFQISVNDAGEYEIWDSAGNLLSNLRPNLGIQEPDASAKLAKRLVNLSRYRNVQELDNHDTLSPLARRLVVELIGKQANFDPLDMPDPQPFNDSGNTPKLKKGEWTFLKIANKTQKVLNITVLDLQPDRGISQIYPSGSGFFEPLDPGQEILLPLQANLPEDYTEGIDIIKVFGTVGTTNFRWLELPALDQPEKNPATRGGPANALEELLALVASKQPETRNLNPAAFPSWEWVTASVEVHVGGQ